jgi:hypothetical protein
VTDSAFAVKQASLDKRSGCLKSLKDLVVERRTLDAFSGTIKDKSLVKVSGQPDYQWASLAISGAHAILSQA